MFLVLCLPFFRILIKVIAHCVLQMREHTAAAATKISEMNLRNDEKSTIKRERESWRELARGKAVRPLSSSLNWCDISLVGLPTAANASALRSKFSK